MRSKAYWSSTIFVVIIMFISGSLAVIRAAPMMKALAHLGYPPYFATLLGTAKLSGLAVLLLPGLVRWKEWAYVGFGITVLSASYSHLSSGDGWMSLEPLATFAALIVSYRTRPASRRIPPSASDATLVTVQAVPQPL
jgi:hypothetical protein